MEENNGTQVQGEVSVTGTSAANGVSNEQKRINDLISQADKLRNEARAKDDKIKEQEQALAKAKEEAARTVADKEAQIAKILADKLRDEEEARAGRTKLVDSLSSTVETAQTYSAKAAELEKRLQEESKKNMKLSLLWREPWLKEYEDILPDTSDEAELTKFVDTIKRVEETRTQTIRREVGTPQAVLNPGNLPNFTGLAEPDFKDPKKLNAYLDPALDTAEFNHRFNIVAQALTKKK